MKKRNFILGGLGGLVFMVFVILNLTVSQTFEKEGTVQLTLTELAAKALPCSSTERCPTGKNSAGGDKPGEVLCCVIDNFGTGNYN